MPKFRNYLSYPAPHILPHLRNAGPFMIADLCAAYNFPTGLNGGGVIGIIELGGGYTRSDLVQFSHLNSMPSITTVDISVSGGHNMPGDPADGEVLLDIQVAAGAYYYCTGHLPAIKMFFAPNSNNAFVDVMQAAVQVGCDVLSISWGADEAAWDQQSANNLEAGALAATNAGLTIFAASGDNASGDSGTGANVDLPAGCPHIIGCGGTTKMPDNEVVWGNGIPNGNGTGGGFSSVFFPVPDWQLGIPSIAGSRMVPDIAAVADPNTGYQVVINGRQVAIGGTSAVAPLYAGLFAAFGKKLGFITPKLYFNANAFVDITQGSNGSFQAAVGPDPCTGLGVPDGTALSQIFTGG